MYMLYLLSSRRPLRDINKSINLQPIGWIKFDKIVHPWPLRFKLQKESTRDD